MTRLRSLFLVGTDTGVGKTTLGTGLLALARRRDLRLAPYKPAESGVDPDSDSDAARLLRSSGRSDLSLTTVSPYRLAAPLSPALSARLESRAVSEAYLLTAARRLLIGNQALLVESAGGLLSPHGAGSTPASLAASLATHIAIDILLVSANRLGAINQCAMASLVLRSFGISSIGIVLMGTGAVPDLASRLNPVEVAAASNLPVLGTLRSLAGTPTPDTIADAISADLDLRPLFSGALGSGDQSP